MTSIDNANPRYAPMKNKPKETYDAFKMKLNALCNEIESCILSMHSLYDQSTRSTSIPSMNPRYIISKQIKHSSTLTEGIDNKIQTILTFEKIESKEGELMTKKTKLSQLESENQSLLIIQQMQLKGINEYRTQTLANNEISSYLQSQQEMKQTIRYKTRLLKATETIIKGQLAQIQLLKKKCSVIRENIAYRKRNEIMALSVENIHCDHKHSSLDNQIDKLKNTLLNQEQLIESESKECCIIIKSQNERMYQINEEIALLAMRVNGMNREMKAKEMKDKEIMRKEHLKQRIKYFKLNKNYSMGMIIDNNVKSLRNMSVPNNNDYSRKNGVNVTNSFRNIINSKSMTNRTISLKKPFNINRIVKIHCMNSILNSHSNRKENKTSKLLSQIESLSNDRFITYTIGNDLKKAIDQSEYKHHEKLLKWRMELRKVKENGDAFCPKEKLNSIK